MKKFAASAVILSIIAYIIATNVTITTLSNEAPPKDITIKVPGHEVCIVYLNDNKLDITPRIYEISNIQMQDIQLVNISETDKVRITGAESGTMFFYSFPHTECNQNNIVDLSY